MTPLLHLVPAAAWSLVGDRYAPDSLEVEGFVHLSAPHQVARVAAARFAGRTDLLLLVVDPDRLDVAPVWEDTSGAGETFPHVHGPIDVAAVVAVHAYPPAVDGTFPPPWEIAREVPAPRPGAGDAPDPVGGTLAVVDRSRAGHELGRATVTGLPARPTVRQLLEQRVRQDVAGYHAGPGDVYVGVVQPDDAVRYAAGSRLPAPRRLDVEAFVAAATDAVRDGRLAVRVGDRRLTQLDDVVAPGLDDEVTLLLARPVVAPRGA